MNAFEKTSEELLDFIEKSPTCFHVVANAAALLEKSGYHKLEEAQWWKLTAGGRYYVTRNGSSIIAFRIPENNTVSVKPESAEVQEGKKGLDGQSSTNVSGFRLICSHTDSPCFKIKEQPEMVADGKYTKLNVEKYGGMLCAPWFDRPLSVAGRMLVKTKTGIETRLINLDQDLLMIPSLAIHMNREANDGYKYNAQTDLCPVFGDEAAKGKFMALVAEQAGTTEENVLGMDLFLYNRQKGSVLGAEEEFIASPRLDDLQCLFGSLKGFLEAESGEDISVFCAFDNEETGSVSRQGAASTFLKDVLRRINSGLGRSEEEYLMALAGSFLISADNAHAVHPNHADKADPVNRPAMNHGIVIKYNANQKYTTDARSTAVLRCLCERAGVPHQIFTNRSDMAGGSTLGNISNTQVSLPAVDIGLAQLAMHSPCEMAGRKDTHYLELLAREFYSARMKITDEKIEIL